MRALLVIDLQNDYFPGGKFPLWNTDATLHNVEEAIRQARATDVPVIHVQHIADPEAGPAPFFHRGTDGADIHPRVRAAAPDAPVVAKAFADAFVRTDLERLLAELGVTELLVCGMMTQNCVTHTAISRSAEKYKVSILPDCCTTVSEPLHLIALHAVSTRVDLVPAARAIGRSARKSARRKCPDRRLPGRGAPPRERPLDREPSSREAATCGWRRSSATIGNSAPARS